MHLNHFHLSPVLWFEIVESKPQFVELPRKVEVPQGLDQRHMDEEFRPACLSRCDELVEELSDMNCERVKHPGDGEDGPVGMVMVTVEIKQESFDVCANVQRRQN